MKFLLTFLLCLPFILLGQEILSEEECIAYALEHNPALNIARLEVEKQQKLKGAAIDLPSTEFSYSRGNINSSFVDYSWQIEQAFEFPGVYATKYNQQKNYVSLKEINYTALEKELIQEVKLYYNDLSYYQQKLKTIKKLDSLYDYFEVRSREKLNKDTANLLENIALISQHNSIDLEINQLKNDFEITKAKLRQLLCIDHDFFISDSLLQRLEPDTVVNIANNPYLLYRNQEIVIARQNTKVQKSRFIPELLAGYFNQQIDLQEGYDGFVVGTNIPLWAGANKSEVQASKIEEEIYIERYKLLKIKLEKEHQILLQTYQKNKFIMDYYDQEGLKMVNALYQVSSRKYNQNEIDYVEYLNNMERSINMYVQYISAVHDYNDAIIQINFLTGK